MKNITAAILAWFVAGFTITVTCVALAGLWAVLSSCGMYEVPKSGVQVADEEPSEPEGESIPIDTEKPLDIAPEGSEVSVDVDVHVSIKVNNNIDDQAEEVLFSTRFNTWSQAVRAAPEGYRLATRAEAIELIDAGALDDQMELDDGIWTVTEHKDIDDLAWVIALEQHFAAPKSLDFYALYVLD